MEKEEITKEELLNWEIERENLLNLPIAITSIGLGISVITLLELFGFWG